LWGTLWLDSAWIGYSRSLVFFSLLIDKPVVVITNGIIGVEERYLAVTVAAVILMKSTGLSHRQIPSALSPSSLLAPPSHGYLSV
jgi:hypothetical protein